MNIKEELLGEKSADTPAADKDEDKLSLDNRRVAWRDKRGQRWVVLLNGQPQGEAYDEVRSIRFSPDGRHLAYAGRRGNDRARSWRLVLDGQEQKEAFGGITSLNFSMDSQHLAYSGQEKNSAVAVVDGKRGPDYKGILGRVHFSGDSQHYAYTAQKGDQWLVVSDGVEGPAYDGAGPPRFTLKGNLLVYPAKRRGAWVVIENGKEIAPEAKGGYSVLGITLREEKVIAVGYDGKRTDRDLRLVIGGQAGPLVDSVSYPVFGATDDHYVYAAHRVSVPLLKANRAFGQIVIDGKEGRQYEALTESTFSAWMNTSRVLFPGAGLRHRFNPRWHGVSAPAMTPDGMHIANAARKGDKQYVMVVDDVEGPSVQAIPCGPAYGPDGKLYYTAFEGGKLITMVDEKRVSEFAWKEDTWTDWDVCSDVLTWEGGHWGYMTVSGGHQYFSGQTARAKRRLIIDGQAGPEYNAGAISGLKTRSAGGAFHFSYEVHENKDSKDASSLVVQDGQEGRPYDAIFMGSSEFLGDKTVTFVARSGRKFLRVTQSLP